MNIEPTAPSSRKILIVEDNMTVQQTVSLALKNKGYQVFTATDTATALRTVRGQKPDLILLDLSFPFEAADVGGPLQDGFFVIEWLRRAPEAEKIPIIIISGTDPVKYKDQISAAGVVACFQKPLKHHELLAAIHTALGGDKPGQQPAKP
jgi:two-component system, chemotaxis family, sensor histidine kinase and response regulator PixL